MSNLPNSKVLVNWGVPPSYDGTTPVPLIFMLHATNQFNDSRSLDSERFFVAGPQSPSRSGTFEGSSVALDAAGSPEVILREVLATVCVDEARLFAVGNGSGGRELVRWMARRDRAELAPRFRAAAVVGAFYGKVTWQPMPLLFTHPLSSSYSATVAQDPDGMKAFASLAAGNKCGAALTPVATPNIMACKSQGGTYVNPGCNDVGDCAAPLRFCHDDAESRAPYDAWPCYGAAVISQFFEQYRD